MRLIVRERESMIGDLNVAGGIVLIGSHSTCDIYLPDGRLAPRHLIIEPEGNAGWTVRPLDTRTATTVNKTLLHSRYRLKTGDDIGFADYGIRVYLDDQADITDRVSVSPVSRMDETQVPTRWPLPADTAMLRAGDIINLEPAGLLLLGQLSSKLYQTEASEPFLQSMASWLLSALKADRAWACLATDPEHDPHMAAGLDASGQLFKAPEKTGILIHRAVQRQQTLLLPGDPTRYASAMVAPLAAGAASLGLVYVERSIGKPPFAKSDLAALRAIGSQAGMRLDEILRGHQQAMKERAQQQLDWAHQVQERLTPPQLPAWDNLELAAYRQTGQSCCGDVYDVIRLPKGTAAIILGHAMAAGAESAVLMAGVRAAFRIALLHADAPHFVLKELNWLVQDPPTQVAMRCFAGLLDPATGQMRFSAAGLPGAYIVRADGQVSDLVTKELPELGAQPQIEYPSYEAAVGPGDSLVLFTRGLITATNEAGEPFGLERIVNDLEDGADKPTHLMLQMLVDNLASHLANSRPHEDVTVLILRRLA